jgi:hypothetical protein
MGPLSRLLARGRTHVCDLCGSAAQRAGCLGANVAHRDDQLGFFPIEQHGAGFPLFVDDERIVVRDGCPLRLGVVPRAAERIFILCGLSFALYPFERFSMRLDGSVLQMNFKAIVAVALFIYAVALLQVNTFNPFIYFRF